MITETRRCGGCGWQLMIQHFVNNWLHQRQQISRSWFTLCHYILAYGTGKQCCQNCLESPTGEVKNYSGLSCPDKVSVNNSGSKELCWKYNYNLNRVYTSSRQLVWPRSAPVFQWYCSHQCTLPSHRWFRSLSGSPKHTPSERVSSFIIYRFVSSGFLTELFVGER